MSEPTGWFDSVDPEVIQRMADTKLLRDGFAQFMLNYQFAMDEIMTKIDILKTEFEYLHEYSPIEHVKARLKSPESLLEKVRRHELPLSFESISENVLDVAGVRIICSFISDAYWVARMITSQRDITVVRVKDYIANPKPNGYKSLHIIVKVPIFLSESVQNIYVELQIRTVAMDFWASLEHKIYYKYEKAVPSSLLAELQEAAAVANRLDSTMERIHNEVRTTAPGGTSE